MSSTGNYQNNRDDDVISLDDDAYDSSYDARHFASQTFFSNTDNIVPKKEVQVDEEGDDDDNFFETCLAEYDNFPRPKQLESRPPTPRQPLRLLPNATGPRMPHAPRMPGFSSVYPSTKSLLPQPSPPDDFLDNREQIAQLLDMPPVPEPVLPAIIKSSQDMIRANGGTQEDVDAVPRAAAAANAAAAAGRRTAHPKEVRHPSLGVKSSRQGATSGVTTHGLPAAAAALLATTPATATPVLAPVPAKAAAPAKATPPVKAAAQAAVEQGRPRFPWLSKLCELLGRQVLAQGVHIAGYGNKAQSYADLAATLNQTSDFMRYGGVKADACSRKLTVLVAEHRAKMKNGEFVSGTRTGDLAELHQLLCDIVQEMDDAAASKGEGDAQVAAEQARKNVQAEKTLQAAAKESGTGKRKPRSSTTGEAGSGSAPTPIGGDIAGVLKSRTDSPATKQRKLDIDFIKAEAQKIAANAAAEQSATVIAMMGKMISMMEGNTKGGGNGCPGGQGKKDGAPRDEE